MAKYKGNEVSGGPNSSRGSGGTQGIRSGAGDPLDVNGTTVKTGDITRTRMTGGLGHATLHSKTPSSGHKFRDDRRGGKD